MVLIIVMIVATLMLVALTAALPSVLQEGEREREAETQFRGLQYGRAVALFHKQFNRYPVNVKELMGTNGMKFLRQAYTDPLDPKGKWRFIHVNTSGVLLDSVNQPLSRQNNTNPAGLGINGSSTSSSSFSSSSSFGSSFSQGGSNPFGSQMGNSGFGSSSFSGNSGSTGFSTSSMSMSGASTGQEELPGAFIAGVAPTSKKKAIKIWKKYDHYNQWEFIGLDMGVFGVGVGMPTSGSGGMGGFGQQNPQQNSPFSTGGFGSGSSTFTPSPGPQ